MRLTGYKGGILVEDPTDDLEQETSRDVLRLESAYWEARQAFLFEQSCCNTAISEFKKFRLSLWNREQMIGQMPKVCA